MLRRLRLSAWFRHSQGHGKRRRARPGLAIEAETLEPRTLLSAVGGAVPAEIEIVDEADDAGHTAHRHAGAGLLAAAAHRAGEFELALVGTSIEYDPQTGLPQHIEADIFYVGGFLDGRHVGTYQEDVTPILHPDYGFIGVTGVSTFEFHGRPGSHSPFGTLNAAYQAFIVGVDESTGAVLVQSTGTIVSGTGVFRHAVGEFTSSSSVHMGLDFAMNTAVTVTLDTQQMLASARQESHDARGAAQGPRWHRDGADDLSRGFIRVDGGWRAAHSGRDEAPGHHWQEHGSRRHHHADHPRWTASTQGWDAFDAAFATLGRTWHS